MDLLISFFHIVYIANSVNVREIFRKTQIYNLKTTVFKTFKMFTAVDINILTMGQNFILKGKKFWFIILSFLRFTKGYSIYKHNSYQEQGTIIPL